MKSLANVPVLLGIVCTVLGVDSFVEWNLLTNTSKQVARPVRDEIVLETSAGDFPTATDPVEFTGVGCFPLDVSLGAVGKGICDAHLGRVIFGSGLLGEEDIVGAAGVVCTVAGFKVVEFDVVDKESGIESSVRTELCYHAPVSQGQVV